MLCMPNASLKLHPQSNLNAQTNLGANTLACNAQQASKQACFSSLSLTSASKVSCLGEDSASWYKLKQQFFAANCAMTDY